METAFIMNQLRTILFVVSCLLASCSDVELATEDEAALTHTSNQVVPCREEPVADGEHFQFCWQQEQTQPTGLIYAAQVVGQLKAIFASDPPKLIDPNARKRLEEQFGVVLADTDIRWSGAQAHALEVSIRRFGQVQAMPGSWTLTKQTLSDDLEIEMVEGRRLMRVSMAAFTNALPREVKVDKVPGIYYSHRLDRVVLRYLTDEGRDQKRVNEILQQRFGVSIFPPNIEQLTREPASRFDAFHPRELLAIVDAMDQLPDEIARIDQFQYLVRRRDGICHPVRGCEAPAIAWTHSGYLEFQESAFITSSEEYLAQLVLHEKSHFLWDFVLDEAARSEWIKLGGWYVCKDRASGWCSTDQTGFVSSYAHSKNPDEDFAESVAYFVVNANKVASRSPARFDWLRDRIMQGNRYVSRLPEQLSVAIDSKNQDLVYPGRINSVTISADGAANEDKQIRVELGLAAADALEFAVSARARIVSESGTYYDVRLKPEVDGASARLVGEFTLSRFARSGAWRPQNIVLIDEQGNERMAGAGDFGWQMTLDNPAEDLDAPVYVPGSVKLSVREQQQQGEMVRVITATWQVLDRALAERNACLASLNDTFPSTYSLQRYGAALENNRCAVEFVMPYYMPAGAYQLNYIKMFDRARNSSKAFFVADDRRSVSDTDERAPIVSITSEVPDLQPPELDHDLASVAVVADPAVRTGPPSGFTFNLPVRDDISGYQLGSFRIRDPQGLETLTYHYPPRRGELLPSIEELDWFQHSALVSLPEGAASGTWGVTEVNLTDRARNFDTYVFTEILTISTPVR